MRALVCLAPVVFLLGCPPSGGGDYYNFGLGYTWEYVLIEGGEDDEFWTLQALDADENDESGRGDYYIKLTRTLPDSLGPGQDQTFDQRRFNVDHEQDLTGSEPVSIGWSYKWVLQEEGDREEYFVVAPGSARDWSDSWSYETGESGGSDFEHEITASRCTDQVVSSFISTADCIEYERTVTTTNFALDGSEQVLTTVHHETWAAGVGLMRYSITASDGGVSTAVLRTTDSAEAP